MFRQGPLPLLVHGLVDYLVGAFLVAMPFLLGFDDDGATLAAVVLGVVLLVVVATSDVPTGLIRSVPRALHAVLDVAVAVAALAAPFVIGFTDDGTATPAFVVVGVVHLLQTIATRFLRAKGERRPRAST